MSSRIAFSLFGLPVYWYGVLIATAVILGVTCALLREKRLGLKKDTTLDFLLLALPVAIICARIYYAIFTWDTYKAHPLSVFNLREGGLAIYGGVIGGIAAALFFCRRRHISFGTLADLCAPSLALGQAIGRWGNFFNQEAYGYAFENPALHFFPASVFIEADQTWHAATFFYESAWCFLICLTLLLLEHFGFLRKKGDGFGLYFLLYGAERAIVEGFRMDSLMMGSLRISQLLSAALMLLVVLCLLRAPRSSKKIALIVCASAAICVLALCIHFSILPGQIISAVIAIAAGMLAYNCEPYPDKKQESCD